MIKFFTIFKTFFIYIPDVFNDTNLWWFTSTRWHIKSLGTNTRPSDRVAARYVCSIQFVRLKFMEFFSGHYKSQEAIKISFHLVDSQDIRIKYELKQNSDLCKKQNNPLNKNKLNDCREIKVKVCVNVIGPKYIFPKSKSVLLNSSFKCISKEVHFVERHQLVTLHLMMKNTVVISVHLKKHPICLSSSSVRQIKELKLK